jgi:L-aminopeptidase/D-esterase-like protein
MTDPRRTTPAGRPRARALGIPLDGETGDSNAITDVPGVLVGYTTLIEGSGPLIVGGGPIRTGVTAILPRGRDGAARAVHAGSFSLNGNGELTGTLWIEETGRCSGPITITNTHSCGVARDATIRWMAANVPGFTNGEKMQWALPVAGETYDGYLNDINGFHVSAEHVCQAIDAARDGPLEEGSVGGGTGMICYEFKGGSGTASRVVTYDGRPYTVGAFVQSNFGLRHELVVAGVPVGRHLRDGTLPYSGGSSIIAVIATDAPLLPHQLKRLARRIALGVARAGTVSHNGSGDIFLAFTTANEAAIAATDGLQDASFVPENQIDPLFTAVVQAIDEAILNSLITNEAMIGRDERRVEALPHDELRAILHRYGRFEPD